jgi:predicted 3-demethylubiquinone-9 3-methyltransferase (glyoxalase superfamily)
VQKITPFLWFDNQAEEAVQFYTSIFKNSRITTTRRYGPEGPGPEGSVMTIGFILDGQEFTALNGGPVFQFTPAISFVVHCQTQAEVDHLWEKLSAGGELEMCGWLRDKLGVSWQIVPQVLLDMLNDPDKKKVQRVTEVMLKMQKL